MTNTIKGFLKTEEASTVRDIATHGVQSGAIGKLIYTNDIIRFFDQYEQDIENVITDYLEGLTGMQYYDLLNYELMSDLENYANVEFQHEDTYIELEYIEAERIANADVEGFEDMDEDEQADVIIECLEFVELEIQDVDKVQFVNLAVEIVAQELAENRSDDTIEYVDEYLLNCETNQEDMLAYVNGTWEDVEVVDILGTVEDEGRIHIGLEVVYNGYAYVEHISFTNVWEYVYKDEMVEISEKIGRAIGEQIEINIMLEKESK